MTDPHQKFILLTRYQQNLELARIDRKYRRWKAVAWAGTILALVAASLMLSGCSTTQPQAFGPAALQAATTLSVQFSIESHPEIVPYIRVATTTVCSAAAGTNIAPNEIVAALNAAGITNNYARLAVNAVLATYNIAYSYYGTNLTQFKPYADSLCQGLTLALPPAGQPGALMATRSSLPPHLK